MKATYLSAIKGHDQLHFVLFFMQVGGAVTAVLKHRLS